MQDPTTSNGQPHNATEFGNPAEQDISVIEMLGVLLKHKRLVLAITLAFIAASLAYGLLTPNLYRSEAKLILRVDTTPEVLGDLTSLAYGIPRPSDAAAFNVQPYLYEDLAKNPDVLDRVVRELHLEEAYGIKDTRKARKHLEKRVDVKVNPKTGVISVVALDEDPARAAHIANRLSAVLADLSSRLSSSYANRMMQHYKTMLDKVASNIQRLRAKRKDQGADGQTQGNDHGGYERELQFNRRIYGVLLERIQLIQLSSDRGSMLEVLESATPPEKPFSPKRLMLTSVSAALGFLVSVFSVFTLEYVKHRIS